MKRLFTILFIFAAYQSYAQDLIIKMDDDSINCKIKEVGPLYISYLFNRNGEIVKGNMATKNIKSYQFNVLPPDSIFIKKKSTKINQTGTGIYLSASAGLGYLTAPLPDGQLPDFYKDYLNELRIGVSYHITGAYFITSKFGVGLHYINYNTNNYIDKIVVFTQNDTLVGPLSDNITTHFFAPTFFLKFGDTKDKILTTIAIGLGYTNYENRTDFALPFLIKASTLGLHAYGTLEYNMGYNFALTAKAGVFSAVLNKLTITNLSTKVTTTENLTEPDNISRFDLHIGFRYKFGNN